MNHNFNIIICSNDNGITISTEGSLDGLIFGIGLLITSLSKMANMDVNELLEQIKKSICNQTIIKIDGKTGFLVTDD